MTKNEKNLMDIIQSYNEGLNDVVAEIHAQFENDQIGSLLKSGEEQGKLDKTITNLQLVLSRVEEMTANAKYYLSVYEKINKSIGEMKNKLEKEIII